jgi:hypothetical protein
LMGLTLELVGMSIGAVAVHDVIVIVMWYAPLLA